MKRILLIGLVSSLCFTVSVQAQLQKGTRYLAGTISFTGNHINDKVKSAAYNYNYRNNSDYFSVNPAIQAGWFVKDNRMIGIGIGSSLNFSNGKSESIDLTYKSKWNRSSFSLSPFIRQYKSLNKKWALFLNTSADLSYIRNTDTDNSEKKIENGYSAGVKITPGISYWISPRFALESDINVLSFGLGYQSIEHTNSVFFNSGLNTGLSNYFSIRASWYLQ